MKVKIKRCVSCKTLLSNSSNSCTNCGSKYLEKGIYTDESNSSLLFNKHKNIMISKQIERENFSCPTCGAGIYIKNGVGFGECSVCGDETTRNGGSFYNCINE